MEIFWIVVGVILVLGVLALIGLGILFGLATNPNRFKVREVALDDVDDYIARRAAFAITVIETTPLSRREVWDRLDSPYLTSLPFLRGPDWALRGGSPDQRERSEIQIDARRTMSGTFLSVGQRVIEVSDRERVTLVGTGVSVPLAVKDFVERFTIVDGKRSNTVTVTWQIAGSPRFFGFLPWRWGVPLVRPVAGFMLRQILRLQPYRRPDVRGEAAA
ncbi:hypothetical protein VZC37_03075 [Gordonia sp. LSe1-13]|uniref:Polyketide cyclase / dehydrase and lipid transport n=1 Tax=Gordonia sesuvii TaxID=3116777 RepID=A0ABU7M855_9ACTN|nr:hypothetical protein [Gordonia sp. LSe1-13]